MINGVLLIATPARIDPAAVVDLELIVLEWSGDGCSTVLIDLTGTRFCDMAGFEFLARTHRQALSQGGELRAVIPRGGAVFRGFIVLNLDHFIPQFSSLDQALALTREKQCQGFRFSTLLAPHLHAACSLVRQASRRKAVEYPAAGGLHA